MDEGNENLVFPTPWDFKRSLTCRKILHGTSGFTSHPKEGVLLIVIVLKNPSSLAGSNRRPLSPMVSTLTTTPPRRLKWVILATKRWTLAVVTWLKETDRAMRSPHSVLAAVKTFCVTHRNEHSCKAGYGLQFWKQNRKTHSVSSGTGLTNRGNPIGLHGFSKYTTN
jgi:hypothetical protein